MLQTGTQSDLTTDLDMRGVLARAKSPLDLDDRPIQPSSETNDSSTIPPLLDPFTQPKFVNDLPIPSTIDATQGGAFHMETEQTNQWLGLYDSDGNPLQTKVWGYSLDGYPVSYPGPTFITQKDKPINVQWNNHLPNSGHLLPVDSSINTAKTDDYSTEQLLQQGLIPTVTHLHGGNTESASDGQPEAWYTQNFSVVGRDWQKKDYTYDNNQQAATLWYHDHAMGLSRLNVYAGLAGFYLLRDPNEQQLFDENVLPSGAYEIPLMLQDRMFQADGQLYYPSDPSLLEEGTVPPGQSVTALPEFFGDFNLVNGMAWPKLEVEPRKYLFHLLNASDSRVYDLKFDDPQQKFYQVGSDDGLFSKPLALNQLILPPAKRADIVVDFSGDSGKQFVLRNYGADGPFQGFEEQTGEVIGGAADPATTGQVMQFVVNRPLNEAVPNAQLTLDSNLRTQDFALFNPDDADAFPVAQQRNVVLFEGTDQYGRINPQLGTLEDGSLTWNDQVTEQPKEKTVETWTLYNTTEDAHPIHLHGTSFRVTQRQELTIPEDGVATVGTNSDGATKLKLEKYSLGKDIPLLANEENAWEDVVTVYPGQAVTVKAYFDRPGTFVWHCHIYSHEDNVMMRPYEVVPA